jgi:predicted alpha/beta-fold hydrolase
MNHLAAHFWTIAPDLRHRLVPLRAPGSREWSTVLQDADVGPVRLTGRLREFPGADTLLVVVHGLGGSPGRHYCVRAARAAERMGWSSLRLALRGADRRGEDFYHGGLTADLEAAIASPEVSRVPRVLLLGYSMGGHVVLRYAAGRPDPRVRAAAVVSAPLDLDRSARWLDERIWGLYRRHVLRALFEIVEAVGRRRPLPVPIEEVRRVRGIREFDRRTVVPRFGFADPEDYYATQSAVRVLGELRVPSLYVGSRMDPMVPPGSVTDALDDPPAALEVKWLAVGGHMGFPPGVSLGIEAPRGVESQVLAWLERRGA